jgi:predicted DNA-binding protein (UPF0278 family)
VRYEDLIAAARIARAYASAIDNVLYRSMGVKTAEEQIREADRIADLLEEEAAREETETTTRA